MMFKPEDNYFHPLKLKDAVNLPQEFTYPFLYVPHPYCVEAADEVKAYLSSQQDFEHNFGLDPALKGLQIGKMFGVMLVLNTEGQLGYISAFSGKLAESNHISGFVPPVYDTLDPKGFYKEGEAYLNQLTEKISELEQHSDLEAAKRSLIAAQENQVQKITEFKRQAKVNKKLRQQRRTHEAQNLSETEKSLLFEELKQQSIQSNLDLKYLKLACDSELEQAQEQLDRLLEPIEKLKQERKALSGQLQKQIHQEYRFLNAHKETEDLLSIFQQTDLGYPPVAAGECAAPKLFQFAYQNQLQPLAMAEFWWGVAPNSEVRRHGQFYPSCRSRCEPILGHMMKGLNVEPNPIASAGRFDGTLEIIYEDDAIVLVNKPHEFLSVPGKTIKDSVLTRMQQYLPEATGALLLHRLDMSTSGLLLVAKTERAHKHLQRQFINRKIKKRYVAVLDGVLSSTKGTIDLPLRVDLNNRPRQLVCSEHGKLATTNYEVINVKDHKTRIYFYPVSGRTHQLRVHAAHVKGLNTPIVGDDLYGQPSNRLHLHAETLSFEHPITKAWMRFSCAPDF
ncbi:MAG: pseudouridine synthase [Winogradskyella arenosi]